MKEIKIGNKGTMAYILEIQRSNETEFMIKARSRLITKAVDIALMYKQHFGGLEIKNVDIHSEIKKDKYGNNIELSVINIKVVKNAKGKTAR